MFSALPVSGIPEKCAITVKLKDASVVALVIEMEAPASAKQLEQ